MAVGPSRDVWKQLDGLFRFGASGPLGDAELLGRFVAGRRDEAAEDAFAALVERHGPMVLGVCRRVLGDRHEAEDAFQATFLVLARKAGAIARREQLANWLHGVASRTALDARARADRRRARERKASATAAVEVGPDDGPEQLRAAGDPGRGAGAIAGLVSRPADPLRAGRPFAQVAARRLGIPEGSIRGALVGVEAVTAEGLKAVYKDFNLSGDNLVKQLRTFSDHGVHVLGSFIFGLPTDGPETFHATQDLAQRSGLTFAQFVMLTPFPGTVDFEKWEKAQGDDAPKVDGIPLTRYWLIPAHKRPKMFMPHPKMSSEEMRARTQGVWDRFYSFASVWKRSRCTPNLRARLAFVFISKLYRQMYASTGITTDSARRNRASAWARWLAVPCRKLFQAAPMPELQIPRSKTEVPDLFPLVR